MIPFVHLRPDWPAFRWDTGSLTTMLASVRHKQGRLAGRLGELGFEIRIEATLTTLTSDVVRSSEIEGETLDAREVRSSVSRHLGLDAAGLPPSSRSIDGVVQMTIDATQNHQAPLTEERLFGWHAALFPEGRSGLRRIRVGGWRGSDADPMRIVSGPVGRRKVHFEAPAAARVASEMGRFIQWFEDAYPTHPTLDPVLKAGVAHLWFETLHPFEDGNGRIGRALVDLLLARADDSSERFFSLSSQMAAERRDYYRMLEAAQRGDLEITPWLLWFVDCLGRAVDAANESLSSVLHKARFWQRVGRRSLNERQRSVLARLLGPFEGALSTSKYATLAKCSSDTALRDIVELVEHGILVRNPGGGRSTSYRPATLAELGSD